MNEYINIFIKDNGKQSKIQEVNPSNSLKTHGNVILETHGEVFLISHQSIKPY